MKKRIAIFIVAILVGMLFMVSSSTATKYTAIIKKGEVISVSPQGETISFEVVNDFPQSIDMEKVIKALIVNNEEVYEVQEKSKIKNIYPLNLDWELKKGKRFRVNYENGVLWVEKIPAKTLSKKKFYGCLASLILIFLLAGSIIPLLKLGYKKIALIFGVGTIISIVGVVIETGVGVGVLFGVIITVGVIVTAGTGVTVGAGVMFAVRNEDITIAEVMIVAVTGAIIAVGTGIIAGAEAVTSMVVLKIMFIFGVLFIGLGIGYFTLIKKFKET